MAAPSLRPLEFPAVTVPPSALNAGLSLARPSRVVSARACSSPRNTVIPFRPGTFTGVSSSVKTPSAFCGCSTTLTFERKTILLFTRDVPSRSDVFGCDAHRVVELRICKSFTQDAIRHFRVAEPIACSCFREQKWRPGHALNSTRNVEFAVAGLEPLDSVDHCLKTAAADAIDRLPRCFDRQPCLQGDLPGRIHSLGSLEHIANNHVCDIFKNQTCKDWADCRDAQIDRRHVLEGTHECADCRTLCRCDYDGCHVQDSSGAPMSPVAGRSLARPEC